MFDKAMRKSIETYLEPGEELLDCLIVQGKGMTGGLALGGVIGQSVVGARRNKEGREGAEEGDVQLAGKMGLAITGQRLLIFKAGGAVTLKAKELITEVPIGDVDSLDVGKAAITKPVTFTVRGTPYTVEAPKISKTDDLVAAFQKAKTAA
jgi:hypothetical protein